MAASTKKRHKPACLLGIQNVALGLGVRAANDLRSKTHSGKSYPYNSRQVATREYTYWSHWSIIYLNTLLVAKQNG